MVTCTRDLQNLTLTDFNPGHLADPGFYQENRLSPHSDHDIYRSFEELSAESSSCCYNLDGVWKFYYSKNFDGLRSGFETAGEDCHNWDEIRVPAHIQMEGYDAPMYTNTIYPWDPYEDLMPGEIPTRFNPLAHYVKYFTLPDGFVKEKTIISFRGVESGFAIWLNGIYIGYSEDSFDTAEFDITDALQRGENKLAVLVVKHTSGSWCEDQDFFRFSGIYRSVNIYSFAKDHIEDIAVTEEFDPDMKNAVLNVSVKRSGSGILKVELFENGLLEYGFDRDYLFENSLSEENEENGSVSFKVSDVKLWSAEKPYLYSLLFTLRDEKGEIVEVTHEYVGFRKFEMKDGLMLINGRRIVFKGANRHEFSGIRGRVPDRKELIQDIVTMKSNNINAIRTCHYPDDKALYRLCDIYGMYLIAENNMETHGTMEAFEGKRRDRDYLLPDDKTQWQDMLLTRVESMYQFLKNHPAIIIWSVGNESCGGSVIFEMSKLFRKHDPSRLVHYEGVLHDRRFNDTSDMESQMYPSAASIEQFLKDNPDKPFICCEYTHAMGNSCGGMHKYTELSDRNPRYQGGFIWDYIDQSIYKKDRYGKEFLAYGGDFGEVPSSGDFSGNGICYGGERLPSPKMQEVKYLYQNIEVKFGDDEFTVINKNLFTDTEEFDAYYSLCADGVEIKRIYSFLDVEPLSTKTFPYPDWVKKFQKDAPKEYVLTVGFLLREDRLWAKGGHEVAFGQKVLNKKQRDLAAKGSLIINDAVSFLGVRGDDFELLFPKYDVGLKAFDFGGKRMFDAVPKLSFWRAPVSNDYGAMAPHRYSQWKIASLYATNRRNGLFDLMPPVVEKKDDSLKVTYSYNLFTEPRAETALTYEVFRGGLVKVSLDYDPVEGLCDMPEFGVMFSMDADYDHVQWYGLGPEETYEDRKSGGKLGFYENHVADNMAAYLNPQECGNKCGVRFARVMDKKGRGVEFFGESFNFSALPYTPHEMEQATHVYELPPVHHTIVRVTKQQMGIGGDDSWGAKPHPEYLLDVTGHIHFEFYFRGI